MLSIRHLLNILLLTGSLLIGVKAAAAIGEPEFRLLKADTLAKQRRIIVNSDGCDVTEYPYSRNRDTSIRAVTEFWLSRFRGTAVDVISYCPFAVGMQLATPSKVTERHLGSAAGKGNKNLFPELLAQGTDGLQLTIDFCRSNHFEVFACMRVNDTHDQWWDIWLSETKRKHPEWLCGTPDRRPPFGAWTAFDFSHREVREKFRSIVAELLTEYDVDGVELDFFRFPCFFKSVAWGGAASPGEIAAMTKLMRDIRSDADRIGRTKGRYLMIAARLPDSARLGMRIGVDVEAFLREKLIDIYIPGADFARVDFVSDAVALGHRYGVKTFPSVDKSWLGGTADFNRDAAPAFAAQSAAALAAGADGVYYFNMMYHLDYLSRIKRTLKDLRFDSKRYFSYYQELRDYTLCSKISTLSDALKYRGDKLWVSRRIPAELIMEIGDDFRDPEVLAKKPDIRLSVQSVRSDEPVFRVSVNGCEVGDPVSSVNGCSEYQIDPKSLRRGKNLIRFVACKNFPPGEVSILKGDALLRGNLQFPWRRLFVAKDYPKCENIVDGSYRISDNSSESCANLLYPLPPATGTFTGEFDMLWERASHPGSVTVRIADGRHVEQIDFMENEISLRYDGKRTGLPCKSGFHHYRFQMSATRFRLYADGKLLLSRPLKVSADDVLAQLKGFTYVIPGMHDRSILVGSLSPEGTGSARWKNLKINLEVCPINDVVLNVKFPPELPARFVAAKHSIGSPAVVFDAADGVGAFKGWRNGYRAGFHEFRAGMLRLDNTDEATPFANISRSDPAIVNAPGGIVVAEATIHDVEIGDKGDYAFTIGLQLPSGKNGKVFNGLIRIGRNTLRTSLGDVVRPRGELVLRLMLEHGSGRCAIFVNDRPVLFGTVPELDGTAKFYFGDGSGAVSGRAWVKKVTLGLMKTTFPNKNGVEK